MSVLFWILYPKALDYCIVAGAFFDFKQQRSDIFLVYDGAWAYNKISFLNFETTRMVSRRKQEKTGKVKL